MPTKPLDRLLFAQGGKCFFCQQPLSPGEASVEHLVATTNGGGNGEDNCAACCKALNTLLGKMTLKEKLRVILNQKGEFRCPGTSGNAPSAAKKGTETQPAESKRARLARIKSDLQKRGAARPGTLEKLGGTINALFNKSLPEQEITALIDALKSQRVIVVTGNKVTYALPVESTLK